MQPEAELDTHQIENLKREAKKLRKLLKITHSAALDILAARHGYKNWSLLEKAANRTTPHSPAASPAQTAQGPTDAKLQQACLGFIRTLSDRQIESLCRGPASLWAPAHRVMDGTFLGIEILGNAQDNLTKQYAGEEDLILLVDFSGIGDYLVFDDDEDFEEDDDGNPIEPADGKLFTPEVGRNLLAGIPFGEDIDSVMERLERFLHPSPDY